MYKDMNSLPRVRIVNRQQEKKLDLLGILVNLVEIIIMVKFDSSVPCV